MRKILICLLLFFAFAISGCSDSSNCNQVFGGAPAPTPAPTPPTPVIDTFSVSGRITGLITQGITVELRDEHGTLIAQTVTDAAGRYNFDGIHNGNYTVNLVLETGTGYSSDPVHVIVADADVTGDIVVKSGLMNHIYSGQTSSYANQIIETQDNYLVIVGGIDSDIANPSPDTPSDYHDNNDIWVLKVDPKAPDKESGILFNHCYGGSDNDEGHSVTEMPDGTIVVVGETFSNDGDIQDYHGGGDIIVLRIDISDNADRGLLFSHCYGGSGEDYAYSVTRTQDNCIALTGTTNSPLSGDVTDPKGLEDILVLKIDPYSNVDRGLLFNHCYGGAGYDNGRGITETHDGCLAVVGATVSPNNGQDVTDRIPDAIYWDIFVLKIDPSDNSDRGILFNHCYGGEGYDYGYGITETSDNCLAVVGATYSLTLDAADNNGNMDILVLKIDPSDNTDRGLLFNHCYGGLLDDTGRCIITETSEGYLAVAATVSSSDNDAADNHGGSDILLLKIDPSDNLDPDRGILFKRCYGGSKDDTARSVTETADGCLAICGYSRGDANDGDIPSEHPNGNINSAWALKINKDGNYTI